LSSQQITYVRFLGAAVLAQAVVSGVLRCFMLATRPAEDSVQSAQIAGLRYVDCAIPGIRRKPHGTTFRYVAADGRVICDPTVLSRIRELAIPPAWGEVWICPVPNGHLQATGRDARGRKQYRYHPKWREVRDETKYHRMIAFGRVLPKIRRQTARHLTLPGLSREKVLASVVRLLEATLIRVGNEEYARTNDSIGLTTMRDKHVAVRGPVLQFEFLGKSRIKHSVSITDPQLARIVKRSQGLRGYELFQYIDESGERRTIEATDVNDYIREVTGERFTAKDFRTWAGTVLATRALGHLQTFTSKAQAKRNVMRAIEAVAKRLAGKKQHGERQRVGVDRPLERLDRRAEVLADAR
jgi:DNA topoisomerase I